MDRSNFRARHLEMNLARLEAGDLWQHHWVDENGNPAGGVALKRGGFAVCFQDGPVKENGVNGVQVEDLLNAAMGRLIFLSVVKDEAFACPENEKAMDHITEALKALNARTRRREAEGTEGYNRGN